MIGFMLDPLVPTPWACRKMTRTHTDEHGLRPLRANAARPCLSVSVRVVLSPALCLVLAASPLALAADKEADTPFCRIFDLGECPFRLGWASEEYVAKTDNWRLMPETRPVRQLYRDTALANDKLRVLLPRGIRNVWAYSGTASGPRCRASVELYWLSDGRPWTPSIDSFRILENTPGAVMIQPVPKTPEQTVVRYRLTAGEATLEIRHCEGPATFMIRTCASSVVVPEFFADDLILSSGTRGSVSLPVDGQFLYLIEGGDAMVMCVCQGTQPRVRFGEFRGGNRIVPCATMIESAKGRSIWLTFIEGKGIWHGRAAGAKDDWKPPFPAKWRCSVAGKDGLAVSYDYEKGPPAGVALPDGPTIIYPIDRTKATPLTTILPIDVMRNTLGVGPCQYVLQAEGLASEANLTPEQVSHWVEQQFKRKKEKAAAAEIKDRLAQMADHVARVQARIGQYAASAKKLRTLCQKHAGDEGAKRCLAIMDHLDQAATVKGEAADASKTAKQLAEAIVALIGKESALEECQNLGEQIRAIGSAQDAALARCRLHVRRLRAECASRPDSPLSKELQPLADQILQKK